MGPDAPAVLVVDDQPRNLDALEVMLASVDCTLVRAHSADEALLELLHGIRESAGAPTPPLDPAGGRLRELAGGVGSRE